ncbi:hypothetical protein COY07_05425 [Candidatus Peregrinibacteria bacterium CG_4_10_14_0_2_um_filter_43_11]|nr:MAG: hypothetical protein COY07_05425 [Candidatus Peregrinibacteria bacterium CG_4_10_14_0_2_um_filter_43_11]
MLSTQEIRSLTHKELLHESAAAQQEGIKIRIGLRTKHQSDVSLAKKHKRYVARLKTLTKEMEIEEMIKNAGEIR